MSRGPDSISRIGQGLVSCHQVAELQAANAGTSLRSICLHGNSITKAEGLEDLAALQELNLSSNALTTVDGLSTLGNLTILNLASNRLAGNLGSLAGLSNLTHLNLSYNSLTGLGGLAPLGGPHSKLRVLNVKSNLLPGLQPFSVLASCVALRELSVAGNPMCQLPSYRQALLSVLPQITQLDNISSEDAMAQTFDIHAAQAAAALRLQAYEGHASVPAAAGGLPPWQQQPGHCTSQNKMTPAIDAVMSGVRLRQQQLLMEQQQGSGQMEGSVAQGRQQFVEHIQHVLSPSQQQQQHHQAQSMSTPQRTVFGMPQYAGQWQQPPAGGQAGGGKMHQPGPSPGQWQGQGVPQQYSGRDDRGVPDQGTLTRGGAGSTPVRKVYLVDAAVQTADNADKTLRALRLQNEQLAKQLTAVTEELEVRNRGEEELRRQLAAAVQAAEDEAHRRVEEGYKEASHAVTKALAEAESARRAASMAQDQASKSEEAARVKLAALEAELTRLREEAKASSENTMAEARKAASQLEEERRRAHEVERALSTQLQAATTEASVARAALTAAEQRISSLEAALAQSSSTTVSMTSQIAQTMADTTAQVDALRAKLAAAEKAAVEASRKEAELTAQVAVLMTNMASTQQQHMKELESVKSRAAEELRSAVAAEVAAAEERGRSAVLVAAAQEKAALQEQLSYLKAQLQFALKEGEKETAGLQEHLLAARESAAELQAALKAASAKAREHEGLVADMGGVIAQQKAHIQVLQKERDALSAQLRGSGTAQVQLERLAAEVASLRGAAAEAAVLKEQADRYKQQWQEAEQRLVEAQVSCKRQTEEASTKAALAEAALSVAREEARAAAGKVEALTTQLTAAEDALKVKRAMLDSANDTIASLKAELGDLSMEAEEARRAAEEAEASAARSGEEDAIEKGNLRAEIAAGEAALESMSAAVAEASNKAQEAEAALKSAQNKIRELEGQVAERQQLIILCDQQVTKAAELYKAKENVLLKELDAAKSAAEVATVASEALQARISEAEVQLHRTLTELEVERANAHAASEAASTAKAEAAGLAARLAEAEGELRALLTAVERQKAASAAKMRQLATLITDIT